MIWTSKKETHCIVAEDYLHFHCRENGQHKYRNIFHQFPNINLSITSSTPHSTQI